MICTHSTPCSRAVLCLVVLGLGACTAPDVPGASETETTGSEDTSGDAESTEATTNASAEEDGDATSDSGTESQGDGDSGDGDGDTGDGDGDSGDGDGDDGDGDGDGDGDSGDGDSGDGDGDGDGICDGPCGSVDCGACPDPAIVDTLAFQITAHEVTNEDYAAFLALTHDMDIQPDTCSWNASYEPSDGWPAAFSEQQFPVHFVDWCDAKAYCEWSGMRLCGGMLGGATPFDQWNNSTQSEWMWACSSGGTLEYPYGPTYDANYCNGAEAGFGDLVQVGSLTLCEGGVSGLFDMSGNVWEWENACENESGASDECRRRGGSRFSTDTIMRCAVGSSRPRNHSDSSTGIRCCADGP